MLLILILCSILLQIKAEFADYFGSAALSDSRVPPIGMKNHILTLITGVSIVLLKLLTDVT